MKILKKFFKFSFIYFLIYPNKIALTDNSQKENIEWKQIDNSSYEIKDLKWDKIDYFNFQKERKNKTDFTNLKNIDNGRFEFGLIQLEILFLLHTLQKVYGIW